MRQLLKLSVFRRGAGHILTEELLQCIEDPSSRPPREDLDPAFAMQTHAFIYFDACSGPRFAIIDHCVDTSKILTPECVCGISATVPLINSITNWSSTKLLFGCDTLGKLGKSCRKAPYTLDAARLPEQGVEKSETAHLRGFSPNASVLCSETLPKPSEWLTYWNSIDTSLRRGPSQSIRPCRRLRFYSSSFVRHRLRPPKRRTSHGQRRQ